MFIEFECPQCQKLLRAGSEHVGKKSKCPNCDKEIVVPEKDSAKTVDENKQ